MGIRRGTATPTKIYRGTTPVKKVMRGTFEVWSASIAVTPAAPTFLAASPWVTLPTVAGVSYSVSGTPGYSQTVTVTATAQAGYELVGQTSWTHTWGPPPRYTAAGSGGARNVSARSSWETVTTHTVTGGGPASGAFTAARNVDFGSYGIRVQVNGQTVAERPYGDSSQYEHTISIPERTYINGQTITFQTRAFSISTNIVSWSWNLS